MILLVLMMTGVM